MTYRKPEIVILGKASVVIEQIYPKPSNPTDGISEPKRNTSPAYDLDD